MLQNETYSLDNIISAGEYCYISGETLLLPAIIQIWLSSQGEKKLQDFHIDGMLTSTFNEVDLLLVRHGGKCVLNLHDSSFVYAFDDSYIDIGYDKKDHTIVVSGFTLNPQILELISALEKDHISKVKKNLVFTIIKNGDRFEVKNMGDGSSELITDNYLPSVIEDIDFVIKSFGKTPPGGRICILNGEPGTGKTHLIRSVLTQMDCIFLIIPSNLIDSLDKPDFLPVLMSIKSEHERPIIMIIEDGDTCLVPRKNDNISTIASLLNLSDGILGSLIDIKMIISTNADIKDMDAAILRPGRLCKNIYVGPLPYDQANKVYQRLTKDENSRLENRRYYTLAEIYDRYNNIDLMPDYNNHPSRKIIGFTPPSSTVDCTMNKGGIGFGT